VTWTAPGGDVDRGTDPRIVLRAARFGARSMLRTPIQAGGPTALQSPRMKPARIRLALVGLTAAGVAVAVLARPAASQSKAFNFVRIADDIYHAVGTGAMTVGCNGAVIINATDVLVVDSHISAPAAAALRDELKSITPKPIRFVVNTHFHFDHAHGNEIYGPEVEIIGHEYTRAQLAGGASKSGRSYASFVGTLPDQIAQVKQRAAAASAAERATLEAQAGIMERHYTASEAVTPTPPTVTLREALTLYRGGREIRMLFLGRGHTGGDVVVHLPRERVIATGDLLAGQSPGYLGDAYVLDWIATLEKLKSVDFDIVLPGHGDAFTGKAKIDQWQAYLRDFWSQAQASRTAGVSAEEASKRIDLRAHATSYPGIRQPGVNINGVLRAYELIEGKVQ
jgi:glyoxylase-like metal-dependent hydrolase (beta-lactamase superfamily II)